MTREEFRRLTEQGTIILDGATGTNLQKAGMPVGVCPEQWVLSHGEVVVELQQGYVQAGTRRRLRQIGLSWKNMVWRINWMI